MRKEECKEEMNEGKEKAGVWERNENEKTKREEKERKRTKRKGRTRNIKWKEWEEKVEGARRKSGR